MNADWKVEKAQYAEFNVPRCGEIAVWQLCRERQPLWNSHDGPELNMLGSMPRCSFPWQKLLRANELLYSSLKNRWVYSKHPCFRRRWFLQVCLGKLSHRSTPLWTSVFFCGCASNDMQRPSFVQGQPEEQLLVVRNILKWMLIEERRRPSMLSSMCQHLEGLTLRCGPSRVPGCKFRFCVQQMIWYWDHMSHAGFLNWFDTGIVCQYIDAYSFLNHA